MKLTVARANIVSRLWLIKQNKQPRRLLWRDLVHHAKAVAAAENGGAVEMAVRIEDHPTAGIAAVRLPALSKINPATGCPPSLPPVKVYSSL